MKSLEELQKENEILKTQLEEKNKEINTKDEKIESLEKMQSWYIEQLKLRQKDMSDSFHKYSF